MKKRIISLFAAFVFIFTTLFGTAVVVKAATSGSCGTNAKYSYDENTKTLTISGSGATKDYLGVVLSRAPWYDYMSEITTVVVQEGITQIGNNNFYECTSLTSLTLPNTLETIKTAFRNCTSLKSVVIPDSVKTIGTQAFDECSKLSSVTLGNSVEKIEFNAFNNTAITEITLPESVSSVGLYAFGNCSFLATVTVHNPNCEFTLDTFANSSQTITFWGHSGSTTQTFVADHPNSNYIFRSLDPCEHTSTHEVITVAPTCTTEGISTQVCDECGFTVSQTTVPATGHTWILESSEDKTEIDGHIYNYYYCENCDEVNTVIEHTAFVEGYYTYKNTATCERPGIETKTCNVEGCGKVEINASPAGQHQLTDVTVTVEPTCTEPGERTGTCTVCGKEITETIPALGHDNQLTETLDNTAEDGHYYEFYTCSVCGEETITATHNEWIDGNYTTEVITNPTCTINGISRDTCTICGETRLGTIPANGEHDWQEVSRTEPTCTAVGRITYECSVCGRTKYENIAALGHDYALVEDKCVAPTCTEQGSNYWQCQRCSATKTDVVDALGHTAKEDSYVIVKEPTCTEEGETTAVCAVCGETYSMIVSALGHDYVNSYEDISDKPGHKMATPTCSSCGHTDTPYVVHDEWIEGYYTTRIVTQGSCAVNEVTIDTCTLCGETRTNNIQAPGHKYSFTGLDESNRLTYKCSVCGNVYTANPSVVKATMWNSTYINTAPGDTTLGFIFELNNDGVINAKDYAELVKYAKKSSE